MKHQRVHISHIPQTYKFILVHAWKETIQSLETKINHSIAPLQKTIQYVESCNILAQREREIVVCLMQWKAERGAKATRLW